MRAQQFRYLRASLRVYELGPPLNGEVLVDERDHSQESPRVRLRISPVESIEFADEDVLFTFQSGRFGYDCISCGAQCCNGHGFLSQVEREVAPQTRRRPAVRFFLERGRDVQSGMLSMANCAQGCFFLQEDRLCAIHADEGLTAKPETCRLFPFNNLVRTENTLIVSPHTGLCPLSILPRGMNYEGSEHQTLLAGMRLRSIGAPVQRVSDILGDERVAIGLERRIGELAMRHRPEEGFESFCTQQLRETQRLTEMDRTLTEEAGAHAARVSAFLDAVYGVLGEKPSERVWREPAFVDVLLACTPFVRSQLVFRRAGKVHHTLSVHQVPYFMLAFGVMLAFARDCGLPPLNFPTVTGILSRQWMLLELLSWAHEPVRLRRDAFIDLRFAQEPLTQLILHQALRALLPAVQSRRERSLGEVLSEILPDDPLQRVLVLKDLAPRLVTLIGPRLDGTPAARSVVGQLKAFAQRVALLHASDSLLTKVAARQTRAWSKECPEN